MLAIFMGWRLYDLFLEKGQWNKEFNAERKHNAKAELEEQKEKLEKINAILKEVSE